MSKRTIYTPKTPFKFTLHVTDHIADTVHLSAQEHGAYLRLMFSYWRSGPPRDDDRTLARIVGMSPDEWLEVRPAVGPFFEILQGQWLHWRLDEELEAAHEAINKARESGKAGAAARWGKDTGRNADPNADAMGTPSECDRNGDPIGERMANRKIGDKPPMTPAPAKASKSYKPGDFEGDVEAAESALGIGGAA